MMYEKLYEQKIYLTDRLKNQLAQIPFFPLTIVEAPSGFGKTTAVRVYLKENIAEEARQYWYTCLSESPAAAWAGLCDLFSNIDKEFADNLKKLGFPTLDTLMQISAYFKNFSCSNETYAVVDNYQLIKSDILPELANVFSMHGNPNLHIIFITQNLQKAKITFHNANIHTVESSAFFFDKESTANLLKMEGIRFNDNELESVYKITEGWIAALRLQISNYKQNGSFDYTADIDHLVEKAIWNRLTPEQKDCLVSLSVLGSFTARQAAIMLGKETLPEQIKELLKGNDFIRYFPREKIYVMHSILQNYLKNQFYQYHSKAFQKKVLRSAGQCCIAETDYFTAAKFFFEIKDFDALLTTPFNGLYLTNKRESNMIEFLKDIIDECPEETMAKYPYVLLMFSYLLRMDGEYEYFQKLCRIIEAVIKNNPAGLDKSELRRIKGEYLLLTSFINYNDIKQVNEGQKAAYELLGGPSMFRVKDIPVTLGATSLLSIFWREPGKLDEILTDVEELLPYNIKLTNGQGTGADIALKAEVLFFRGDDIQAEIFCHKAIYLARSKQEIYICLCAEQTLARIAILRGDVNGFFTVLDNIKGYAGDHANVFVLRMVDICLSALSVALGTKDLVAKWFCDIESISRKVYARAVPYVSMLYLYLLVKEKRYAELLGLADNIINMSKEMNYVLPQVYIYIYKAEVYYKCGREREALENLKEAFVLAFPDKILLPFAQFNFIGDMLSKANFFPMLDQDSFVTSKKEKDDVVLSEGQESAPEYKAALKEIMMLFKRYNKGKIKILNALSQTKSPLTPREREVALLARARLSNKEIAEKLHISQATVRTILYNAYNKLGIHSKYELNEIDF